MGNILITGGAGFIGSSLAVKLAKEREINVIVIDNLLTGLKRNIPKNIENLSFINGDVNKIEDLKKIFESNHFNYVFHYAAVVGVQRTLHHPEMVLSDIKGIENIIELSKENKVKRVFYSSSSEVYGESVDFPQNENSTPLNSKLPYAVVKNVGEVFLHTAKQLYDLDYTIFRFFNTYGIKQSADFVVSKFINAALKNEPLTIYGDGSQTRTFCYIDDNVDAAISCLDNDLFINDTLNIGSENEITILELAKKIIQLTDSGSKIIHKPALKKGDMSRRQPDNSKMKKVLNRNLTTLDEGLSKIIRAMKLNHK